MEANLCGTISPVINAHGAFSRHTHSCTYTNTHTHKAHTTTHTHTQHTLMHTHNTHKTHIQTHTTHTHAHAQYTHTTHIHTHSQRAHTHTCMAFSPPQGSFHVANSQRMTPNEKTSLFSSACTEENAKWTRGKMDARKKRKKEK